MKKVLVITLALGLAMPALGDETPATKGTSLQDQVWAQWHVVKKKAEETVDYLLGYFDLVEKKKAETEGVGLPTAATAVAATTSNAGTVAAPGADTPTANTAVSTSAALATAPAAATTVNTQAVPTAQVPQVATGTKTVEQGQMAQLVSQTRAAIQNKQALKTVSTGRAGSTVLPKTKAGVPLFSMTKKDVKKSKGGKQKVTVSRVKAVPRLDIGLEKTISKNDFLIPTDFVGLKLQTKPKELPSPELHSNKKVINLKKRPIEIVKKAKAPNNKDIELGSMVTQAKIAKVKPVYIENKTLEALRDVKPFSRDDLRMVTAVMIYEKGDQCHLASGLFNALSDQAKYAEESNFYLGMCAHQMGFHSEAVERLTEVVKSENKEFTPDAITSLVEDLPQEYDVTVAPALRGLKNKSLLPVKAKDNFNYILARSYQSEEKWSEAGSYAALISEGSKNYANAQYILGISQYAQKQAKAAENTLIALREWLRLKSTTDKNLEALIAVNIARMRFTQGRYQSSLEEYMKIPKDHPVWVQALIEQGWTQLNIDDPEGAIGNMYSLHSPYFRSVFMPESWVVRTLGYINICQYGDAYRSLTRLENMHHQWLTSISAYSTKNKDPKKYYETVKTYIQGKSDNTVDGLPPQVIREIARQRGFLNSQNALNVLEDEITQYTFINGLIKKDQASVAFTIRRAKERLAKLNTDLAKAKNSPALAKFVNEWSAARRNEQALIAAYEYQAVVYEEARQGFLRMKTTSLARINGLKSKLRGQAASALVAHLQDLKKQMNQVIEGNEFLRYEIFAGSGENIRYQVAGGETADTKRIPANVKPQKIMNWEFDGEFWEDEIGSYRSTLKNNCPNAQRAVSVEGEEPKTTAVNF